MHTRSIFWFRQDLRTQDNTGLFEAIHNSEEVLPVFILDTRVLPSFGGLSDQKFGFVREALDSLSSEIMKFSGKPLLVLHGDPRELIPSLVYKYKIDAVFTNTSYGQSGRERDSIVAEKLHHMGCRFESHKDFLLVEPHEVELRKVFTPFYKLWQKVDFDTQELEIPEFKALEREESTTAASFIDAERHPNFSIEFGKKRFENHISSLYDEDRNDLDKDGTSILSIYLRFGIFSIRQIYNKAKYTNQHYVSELAWREFWHHIYYHFPNTKHQEFLEKRRGIEWSADEKLFEAWKQGKTGYPVVDAAMRQLNSCNWMHGRARMICASFLTKDLHIDWRLGEAYFREKLLDYDEAVNIGNWQWSASVGADPKPLRIFNPILQSEKFSKQARYIKKYLPEVELEKTEHIHNPLKFPLSYMDPIVDHSEEQRRTKEYYKAADTGKS